MGNLFSKKKQKCYRDKYITSLASIQPVRANSLVKQVKKHEQILKPWVGGNTNISTMAAFFHPQYNDIVVAKKPKPTPLLTIATDDPQMPVFPLPVVDQQQIETSDWDTQSEDNCQDNDLIETDRMIKDEIAEASKKHTKIAMEKVAKKDANTMEVTKQIIYVNQLEKIEPSVRPNSVKKTGMQVEIAKPAGKFDVKVFKMNILIAGDQKQIVCY